MSNKSVLISVLMSVRNGGEYLSKSVNSVLNQTFSDFEFIICDDGSTDNTYDILLSFAAQDKRIKLLQNETSKGLAYSLNRCIEVAQSEILARQDADDASELNRFEKQYEFVMKHPEYAIVGTCWNNVDSRGCKTPVMVKKEPSARDMVAGGMYMHPSWMMRKSQLAKVGYYTANKYTMRSQDYHLVMKLLGVKFRIYNMQIIAYNYTADDNTTNRYFVKSWQKVKSLMWIRFDAYRRNHLPLHCYAYVFKPLIQFMIPKMILKIYYKHQYGYE